ncbi:MAG: flavodoxin domain-containing protein [Dehalococcoidia bacterium]|nr:flavodoxin domain-containing protein [Dehalococcoidia bacterium]
MKFAVRYQSRGGNTRAVAEVIAESLDVEALSISEPVAESVDVLFLGGGVYMWDIDAQLKQFMHQLAPDKIGQIVPFCTGGSMKTAIGKIRQHASKSRINVSKKCLGLRLFLQGNVLLRRKGGHLTDKQIARIKTFTSEVLAGL